MMILLAGVLILSMGIPTFASEEEQNVDVIVKYISRIEEEYEAQVIDDAVSVDVEGISVSVRNVPEGAARLLVRPIPTSEKEARAWFIECLKDDGVPLAVYDIYFLNAEGSRINTDGSVITIDYPSYEGTLIVCSVSTDGTTKILASTIENGTVKFTTDGSNYYVLAEQESSGTTDPGKTDTSTTTPPDDGSMNPPSTGDNSNIGIWISTGTVSLVVLLFLILSLYKRIKKNEE